MPDASGDQSEPAPARDWKKLFIVTGLGTLSWVATYVGMLELIESNMGDLPIVHKLIIGFSVAMLMTMIVWLLDQIFSPIGITQRLIYVAGYIFLSIISVGFGFGFYWKVLESRSEASRSAESAVTGVQSSLNAASTRLEQLNATLAQLATVSRDKAELERTKGTSCPNSKPGDGPRRRMRDEDSARFSFASEFVSGRVTAVKADMSALDGDLAKIAADDPTTIDPKTGTRNEFMKALGRRLDLTVSSFNALRTDPQLKELRQDLAERADRTAFGDPKNGGFQCPDTQLSQALRGAVRAINELPVLEKPTIAAVEGSEATIEAFRRLTATFYGLLSFELPPSADELRELQKKAIQSVEGGVRAPVAAAGLSSRDYVPLGCAIFVDICLLLVSIGRPMNRLHGLMPKMREAERGPVIEILSRFNDIHRDAQVRESFELFRHVVFDVHGAYYVAVPLDAPAQMDAEAREALRVEVQLLANLFTSFETDRIFRRTWTPLTGTIKRKLRRQGSKFAESNAFRVYRFRDGAWSEIILGAVMGAARRAEAEAHRQRIERDLMTPASKGPTDLSIEPVHEPVPSRAFKDRTSRRTSERSEPSFADHQDRAAELTRKAPLEARLNPDRVAQFGVYAQRADADIRTEKPDETPPRAANSNTAPTPAARRSASPPESAQASNDRPASESSVLVTENPLTMERSASATDRVNVVLKRETATLSLHLDDQTHSGLVNRIGEALDRSNSADVIPTIAHQSTSVPQGFETHALELLSEDVGQTDDEIESKETFAIDADPATEDAVAIAGRLRPSVSGERG